MKVNIKNYRELQCGEIIKSNDIFLWEENKGYEFPHDWMIGVKYHKNTNYQIGYHLSNKMYRKINLNKKESNPGNEIWQS